MTNPPVQTQFLERLLEVMDRKHHWAWPHFTGNFLSKEILKVHFQQEYAVYVRDFPVFLARILGKSPPMDVRTQLALNIYEEETGGFSFNQSHPNLFLMMMEGLGYDRTIFDDIALLPASRAYRRWLDRISLASDWRLGVAALTIFVEGSVKDRQEIQRPSAPKSAEEIERIVQQHPLVQHYGISPKNLDLIRAHQMVEAGHRHSAYEMTLAHAVTNTHQSAVLRCLSEALKRWLRYRDGVARACGLRKP